MGSEVTIIGWNLTRWYYMSFSQRRLVTSASIAREINVGTVVTDVHYETYAPYDRSSPRAVAILPSLATAPPLPPLKYSN